MLETNVCSSFFFVVAVIIFVFQMFVNEAIALLAMHNLWQTSFVSLQLLVIRVPRYTKSFTFSIISLLLTIMWFASLTVWLVLTI